MCRGWGLLVGLLYLRDGAFLKLDVDPLGVGEGGVLLKKEGGCHMTGGGCLSCTEGRVPGLVEGAKWGVSASLKLQGGTGGGWLGNK